MHAHDGYAAQSAREHACLHGQWQAFCLSLVEELAVLSGDDWNPGDYKTLYVGPNYAAWTVYRSDGFPLKLTAQRHQGVASMDMSSERANITRDGASVPPLRYKRPAIHVFDRFANASEIAQVILDRVVHPMVPVFRELEEVRADCLAQGEAMARNSDVVASIVGYPATDPSDETGRTHLIQQKGVFGRVRLGRWGIGTVELSGLTHSQIVAIAQIIAGGTSV